MPRGMLIGARTHKTAVKSAINAIFLVVFITPRIIDEKLDNYNLIYKICDEYTNKVTTRNANCMFYHVNGTSIVGGCFLFL